ncbi:unnamed protein product [Mytilus coruscus]|uniref:Uncharacterized protein n=1 Tax=Mytilus coruscus TaxID=42192 RepID=A0A6J8ANR4_MYTCO|nr:unnamed protein product [Mytilus coruscus]
MQLRKWRLLHDRNKYSIFQAINQLLIILNPIRLDNGDGIEDTLKRNNAKYHQNCRAPHLRSGDKTGCVNPVVFHLADLASLYKQRLEQLGMQTPDNPTPSKANLPLPLNTNECKINLTVEHEWLERVSRIEASDEDDNIAWSEHHASKKRGPVFDFMKGLDTEECSFYQPIKKNKTDFVRQKSKLKVGDSKKLKRMTVVCSLHFSYSTSLENVTSWNFQHENQSFPAAMSDNGNFHNCQKSQLATILETYFSPPDTEPEAGVIILDGSAFINALPPRKLKTFEEYAALEVVSKVQTYSYTYKRTDIVFEYPPTIDAEDHYILERFVVAMYDRFSDIDRIDKARLELFVRKQRSYDSIPPTEAALIQHVKRAAYQAGCMWG